MRLCATPSNSSFLWPSNLITNNVTPYSGKLCHAWINLSFASISDKSLTFACASRIRGVAYWNEAKNKNDIHCPFRCLPLIPITFPRSFLQMRGDRKAFGSIESGFMLTTGPCAGFCMLKNDLILITSVSYELSANDRPFDAKRHAAIHLAYWSSCKLTINQQTNWIKCSIHLNYNLSLSWSLRNSRYRNVSTFHCSLHSHPLVALPI